MIQLRMRFRIKILGPILTQATAAGRHDLDAVMARTADGKPYIPYSQIRGKLRQALEELSHHSQTSDSGKQDDDRNKVKELLEFWFGRRRAGNDTDFDRGCLCFTDFIHPKQRDDLTVRTRIRIDEKTGTAQDRMLMDIDSPFAVGEEAEFDGDIICICPSEDTVLNTAKYLTAGLRWIRQIGAERTIGFGRVTGVDVMEVNVTQLTASLPSLAPVQKALSNFFESRTAKQSIRVQVPEVPPTPGQSRYAIRIRPRMPFCIAGIRYDSNRFKSEDIIPGGVIVGTLATMMQQASGASSATVKPEAHPRWPNLAKHFSSLHFTHAMPSLRGVNRRPVAIPLSLVAAEPWVGDIPDTLYDVALCTRPRWIPNRNDGSLRPPVFQSDWKSHVVSIKAQNTFGHVAVPHELRVRTAIDSDSLRAADEHLFAYDMVVPDQHEWLGYIDLSQIPEEYRSYVLKELVEITTGGLGPFGKTKCIADFSVEPCTQINAIWESKTDPLPDNRWVVTLQTPAVLCGPLALKDRTGQRLKEDYQKTWNDVSNGSLELQHFFASQTLAAPRFAGRLPRNEQGDYYPFVLTDAGSTFVLKSAGSIDNAQSCIESLLNQGLPVRKDLLGGKSEDGDPDWMRCPYLNRHGYGEISVNHPWLINPLSNEMPIRLEDE